MSRSQLKVKAENLVKMDAQGTSLPRRSVKLISLVSSVNSREVS